MARFASQPVVVLAVKLPETHRMSSSVELNSIGSISGLQQNSSTILRREMPRPKVLAGEIDKDDKDVSAHAEAVLLQQESLQLDHLLQDAAGRFGSGSTQELLRMLHLCASCDHLEEMGKHFNGGSFVMCTDNLDRGLIGAYSYGITGKDDWGMAIAQRYNIPVFEFDCLNPAHPNSCEGCRIQFNAECLFKHDGNPPSMAYKTLATQLEESGNRFADDDSLLMKMNVASHEWQILYEEPVHILQKFRQIVVEYHHLDKTDLHSFYVQALKTMHEAGFGVVNLRGRSHGGMMNIGQYQIPTTIEVTYVQKPAEGCSARFGFHSPEGASSNLQGRPSYKEAAVIQDDAQRSPNTSQAAAVEDEAKLRAPAESHGCSLLWSWVFVIGSSLALHQCFDQLP